ncbi:acyl-CoA dehydrogenase family protein [Desulfuromonas sp. TF]|uniref:acyl-CoA dehydrogenase family protein n=1 Tax=Desulfuromonas sp. TF TaxID=1232410 RepID=UPI0003F94B6E|nr:acyl-CoA dehydrogenase family protein [Desulfuromonas sp. TF]
MAASTTDFLDIDDLLAEPEKAVRARVRTLVEQEVLPIIEDCYDRGEFPRQLIPRLAGLGLLGMKLSGYGCAGANSVSYGLACQELERGDSGLRSLMSVMSSLVMYPIHTFGSEEQKREWLPALARGEKIGCYALTEPEAGSDPGNMKTFARRDGKDWILSGVKRWISYGSIADVTLVWARTEEGIRGFLVETGTPGFTAGQIPRMMSLRASVTSTLILDDVRVPERNRLPEAAGLRSALMCLDEGRLGIAWGAMGAAMACYEMAVDYAGRRIQFERPIASFQLTQQKLVKMLTEISKGQLLALRVSRLRDQGRARPEQISMAKMNNVAEALKIARAARGILGGNGISLDFHVIRHMCNLESVYTYEGTHEVHTLILGEAITGLSAFS